MEPVPRYAGARSLDEELQVSGGNGRPGGNGAGREPAEPSGDRLRAEAAERNNAEKSRLLASVSHDLRTPLTTIMLRAELLEIGIPRGDAATAQEHARYIQEASQHMLFLVDQLQSFVRMEAGRERLQTDPVDLVELCRGVERFVRPLATQKGLALSVRLPDAPLPAVTDAGKVRQALVNLLSNAVKFTDLGEVGLSLRARPGAAVLHVWDTGVGIPPEHRERIFEPFWQGRHGSRSEVRGSGLGLAITRNLVGLLGGRVRLRSRLEAGTCVSVRLPLASADGVRATG
jgi:signal transduction histidine kinase